MKRKKWERGGGTYIGYAIAMTSFCTILILLIGLFQIARTSTQLEHAADKISRDIVVCESLEEAQILAQEELEAYMEGFMIPIKEDHILAEVYYNPGSDAEWKKGNFINLLLTTEYDSRVPFISGTRTVSAMVMIEQSEKEVIDNEQ